MGRFSRLETGQAVQAPPPADPPELLPAADYYPSAASQPGNADLDLAGNLDRADQALFRLDFRGATRWYSRAMDQDSTRLEPWIGMIRALTFANRPSEVYTWIGRGLTLFPNSIELMALRAVNHARRGMVRRAMNNSDAALEQAPNLPLAHMARGEVLILAENKNYDFCFEQCIKLSAPGDWKTPFLVGMILEERRLWGKALTYYTTTAERFEHNPALWYHVGRCRSELGHGLKAERAFEQARELCKAGDPLLARLGGVRGGALWNRVRNLFRRA